MKEDMKEDMKKILTTCKDDLKILIADLEEEENSEFSSLINQVKILLAIKTNTKSFIDYLERLKVL
jgi:hypothetical protein